MYPFLATFRRVSIVLLVVGALTALWNAHPVWAQNDAQAVVDRLRTRLQSAKALQVDFNQTYSSEYFDDTESSTGTAILQGSRYRVVTSSQVFVSDGVTTWIYDAVENQVLVNDYVEDETTVSLNTFLSGSGEKYRADQVDSVVLGGAPHDAVKLDALDPAAFFPNYTLYVRQADEAITRLEVVDLNGTTITFELGRVVFDPPIPDDTFTFEPDSTSDIVDLRSS